MRVFFLVSILTLLCLAASCGSGPASPTPTPAVVAPTATYRFVTWADSKDHTCVLYGLARLASARNPAFTIFPGDLTPDTDIATDTQNLNRCPGNASQNVTWKTAINGGDPGSGLWDRTFASKGNHDDVVGDWQAYFNFAAVASRIGATHYNEFLSANICGANPCRAYSFDYENSHFVGADVMSSGNVGDLPADIVTWMDGDLTAAEGRTGIAHAFLFWHGPTYGVDDHTSIPSSRLISLLNQHAIVAAAFHGHEHVQARVHVDSAHVPGISRAFEQFVSGGAGANLYRCNASKMRAGDWCVGQPSDPPPYGPGFNGYTTVDVQANEITVRYYDALDVQRASFSFTHP